MVVWNLNYAAIPGISPGDEKYGWSVVRADWSNRPAFDALAASATGQAYTLTLAASPAGGGTVAASPPGPAYAAGTAVSVTAAPNAGYSFAGWTVDGAAAGAANPLPLTMNAGHAVVAAFAAAPAPPPSPPPATSGLQYYPLPRPIRLLDTRAGQPACLAPGAPVAAGGTLTVGARPSCDGVTIPAGARAVVGNATVVNPASGGAGYVTLWPSGAGRPAVSNLN